MTNVVDKQVVLIVDDEPVNIALLQTLLKQDYRLLAATNGKKAIQIAESDQQPDLILLDVMMPDMDGFSVLKKLKENPKTSHIAVLFVTAKLDEESENKGLMLGALDYLIKPINTTAVKLKVAAHLTSIRQHKFIESLVTDQAISIIESKEEVRRDHKKNEQLIKQYMSTIHVDRERLKLALWASENELWDWDLQTWEVKRNNEFESIILPSSTSEDIFAVYCGYIHPMDMERFRIALEPVLEGKSNDFELEYRIRSKPDGWIWIRDQGKVVSSTEQKKPLRMVGTIKNINSQKQVEKESRTLAIALEHTSDGVWIANADLKIEIINDGYTNITGWHRDEVIGQGISFPVTEKQDDQLLASIKEQLSQNQKWSGEVWDQGKNKIYPQDLRIDAVHNEEDDTTMYVGVFTDITFRKQAEKELINLANYDQLTNLPNRTLFYEHLQHVTRKGRIPPSKLALLFIDLDNFKRVNDSLGHDVGDELLVSVAQSLNASMRSQDFVARFGGDEFIMIVDYIEHSHVAAKVSQRIIDSISKIRQLKGHDVIVTPSIGIAIFPEDGETGDQLLKNADRAMYVSKEMGKSTYRFFTDSMNSNALARLDLEAALRKAIDNDEIELHYQPKVNLETGDINGLEVLARWTLDGQPIGPNTFIPIAEEAGLIIKLGEKLLYKACLQYRKWVEMKLCKGRVAVNLSAQQFDDEDLISKVENILSETGLPANYLELEITESMVMNETQKAIKKMHSLRKIGVALSIDDFGTGYSSLSYLKDFPVNTLKIDRCFIDDMLDTRRSRNIVELIVDMAHALDMKVVAEGVETVEQAEAIKGMHAEEMQGYLFSKPLPAKDFEELLIQKTNLEEKLK